MGSFAHPIGFSSSIGANNFGNLMVPIRAFIRVNMRHHVDNPVPLQDAVAGRHRYIMPLFHTQGGIHFQVRVHHNHVTHFAGTHIVHIAD